MNENYHEALIIDRYYPCTVYCATPLSNNLFVLPMRES